MTKEHDGPHSGRWLNLASGRPRNVVVSQGSVNDASTAVLMSAFGTQIAEAETHPTRGPLNYARALRDATSAVRNKEVDGKKPWADPFYWAPSVLVGSSDRRQKH